jgi:hypothetical protein
VTVSSVTNRVSYTGNGSTTAFAFSHPFRLTADLVVTVRTTATGAESLKVEGSDYTVSGTSDAGTGGYSSGTVTFGTAPATGTQVHIDRVVTRTQTSDFISGDGIPPASIEGALDKLSLSVQELDARFARTLLQPRTAANRNLVLPEPTTATANQVLAVNTAGTAYALKSDTSGLSGVYSVRDFGAVGDGTTDDLSAFNAAVTAASTAGVVFVPPGSYSISGATNSSFWLVARGASIVGLSDINGVNDTSRLTGRMVMIEDDSTGNGVRIGDTAPWLESIRFATVRIAEASVLSSSGKIGFLAGTRTSDDLTANFAGIGIAGYGINDNATNPEPVWAAYFEARRSSGAGAAYCFEADLVNNGTTFDLDPFTTITTTTGQTVNAWITNGGGDAALSGATASAALAIHPNPAKWKRGIVLRNDSLDGTTNEALSMPRSYLVGWYESEGQLSSSMSGIAVTQKNAADSAAGITYTSKKWRGTSASGTASQSLDAVHRHNFYGCSGSSTDYLSGYSQILQRSAFSGGHARFSWDVEVRNADASWSQVTLNGLAEKSFAPYPDATISLGTASFRWTNVHTGQLVAHSDTGGTASTNTITGGSDVSANSTGVGSIKFKGATSRDSAGFIKIYIGTTAYYVPVFSAITG